MKAEHNPPHFHVSYGRYEAEISIRTGEILEGKLPRKILKLIKEWHKIHQDELLVIWETQKFKKIAPLNKE